MGMVRVEEVKGNKISVLKITGVEFESIENYVDRQNDLIHEIGDCEQSIEEAKKKNTIQIGREYIPVFDHTRLLLLDFLDATKMELERVMREMPLVIRIRTEEQEGEEIDE